MDARREILAETAKRRVAAAAAAVAVAGETWERGEDRKRSATSHYPLIAFFPTLAGTNAHIRAGGKLIYWLD